MPTLIIGLAIFYLFVIIAAFYREMSPVSKTMGVNKNGELVWMKKKELKRIEKQRYLQLK